VCVRVCVNSGCSSKDSLREEKEDGEEDEEPIMPFSNPNPFSSSFFSLELTLTGSTNPNPNLNPWHGWEFGVVVGVGMIDLLLLL